MASPKKKYGLILASARRAEELRSAAGGGGVRKINVLRTSDDELEEDDDPCQEEESQPSRGKKRGEGNSAQQAQQMRIMREALEEDPSIFMYDEHYDDQKAKQTAVEVKKKQNNEPKYIGRILQSAQRRQLERERCTVRKVQKERDAEQGFFDDKESFVTPAYVKKLEEIRQAEVREKMMEVIEEKNDAMRDRSTSLFYKEIFNQRLGGDAANVDAESVDKTASSESVVAADHHPNAEKDLEAGSSSRKRSRSPSNGSRRIQRKLTDRQPDGDNSKNSNSTNSNRDTASHESGFKRVSDSHTPRDDAGRLSREFRNSDQNSKNSNGDENSTDNSTRPAVEFRRTKHKTKDQNNGRNSDLLEKSSRKRSSSKLDDADERDAESPDRMSIKKEIPSSPESATESSPKSEDPKKEVESKEDRVARLFAKRTIGDKFIEAQQRYLQRKADRSSSRGGL